MQDISVKCLVEIRENNHCEGRSHSLPYQYQVFLMVNGESELEIIIKVIIQESFHLEKLLRSDIGEPHHIPYYKQNYEIEISIYPDI